MSKRREKIAQELARRVYNPATHEIDDPLLAAADWILKLQDALRAVETAWLTDGASAAYDHADPDYGLDDDT